MSFDKGLKKYEKIGSGFLLFLAGMSLAQCYDAYHTLKEYDKLSLAQELGEDDSLTFSVFRDEKLIIIFYLLFLLILNTNLMMKIMKNLIRYLVTRYILFRC